MLHRRLPSTPANSVTVSVDNRSLAARHWSLSSASCPTPAVLAGSIPLPWPSSSKTRSSNAWSISSPEKSGATHCGTDGFEVGSGVHRLQQGGRGAAAAEIEQPDTRLRSGSPSSAFAAVNDATASETNRGAMPLRTKPTCVRKPLRNACIFAGFQYAGTAIEISEEPDRRRRQPPSRPAPRPSAGRGRGWIRRRTPAPRSRRCAPRSRSSAFRARSSPDPRTDTPIFGAQCGYSVSTARRVTGGLPSRAATRFVVPIDNPRGSYIERILSSTGVGGQR